MEFRMKLTIYRYILNELWPTFFASLFVLVFIIMATRMLSITELIVNRGVYVGHVFRMVLYLLPDIMAFSLPAASLMAVLLAFLRLSVDSEIIALKSSGVSLYQMLPPVVGVSFVAFLIALMISGIASPWGNRSFKDLIFQIAESKADLGIKERVFSEPFDDVVLYVNSFSSRERVMKNVFVVDRRDKRATSTIIAEKAGIYMHPEKRVITLRFLKGTVFVVEKDLKSARTIKFNTYDLNIGLKDIMAALAERQKRSYELSFGELIKQLREVPRGGVKYNKMIMELLERCSLPLAVFLMGIIGMPLGAQIRARGRSAGIWLSLAVFCIYYMCLAGMRNLCGTGAINPEIGVWIPDIFLAISCCYLLWRVANERSINLLSGLSSFLSKRKMI
jgi:lipopolysaccharide export system permease protein